MKQTKQKTKAQLAKLEKKRIGRKGRGNIDADYAIKLQRMMGKKKKVA